MTSFRAFSKPAMAGLGLVVLLGLTGVCVTASEASAQSLFWDWGAPKTVKGSGRQLVRLAVDAKPGEIIVSFSDRKLYYMVKPGEALSYPVAIPREKDRWEGTSIVSSKRENPSWTPTPTMIKENPRLPSWVPGGHPMNPLGVRALYLGESMYRIHGTDAPWTIGTDVSKGCIRMYNADVLDLYPRVKTGAKVLVTWQRYATTPIDGDVQTGSVQVSASDGDADVEHQAHQVKSKSKVKAQLAEKAEPVEDEEAKPAKPHHARSTSARPAAHAENAKPAAAPKFEKDVRDL